MLRATNLSKHFGDVAALDGVNLSLAPGKIAAVIGPSGCGKSTLLRALALTEPPDAGTIEVDDQGWEFPLPPDGERAMPHPWPKVLVVFQSLFLWPHLSLRRNIELPLENVATPDRAWTQRLIDALDVGPFLDRLPYEASLGQRQRVALVRALVLQPKYLLLDEVTSALDLESTRRVIGILREVRARDTAVLLVTHQLRIAQELADEVLLFDKGRIIEQGPPEMLVNPQTERLREFLLLDSAPGA